MDADFVIEEVYNPKAKDADQKANNLIFRVKWNKSNEIAFVNFDLIKRRYSHILLDYLTSKIQLKNSAQIEPIIVSPQTYSTKK